MVERVILIVAAILVGLLFLFAVTNAPPKDGSVRTDAGEIDTGVNLSDYDFDSPVDTWFQENVVDAEGVVLVDFKADWCGPCKMLHPHLEELASKYADRLTLVQIDVDERRNLARHYKIEAMPTVLLFADGKVVGGFLGYRDFPEVEAIYKFQTEQVEVSSLQQSKLKLALNAN